MAAKNIIDLREKRAQLLAESDRLNASAQSAEIGIFSCLRLALIRFARAAVRWLLGIDAVLLYSLAIGAAVAFGVVEAWSAHV